MSSARKRAALQKANTVIDNLRTQLALANHHIAMMDITVNTALEAADLLQAEVIALKEKLNAAN